MENSVLNFSEHDKHNCQAKNFLYEKIKTLTPEFKLFHEESICPIISMSAQTYGGPKPVSFSDDFTDDLENDEFIPSLIIDEKEEDDILIPPGKSDEYDYCL